MHNRDSSHFEAHLVKGGYHPTRDYSACPCYTPIRLNTRLITLMDQLLLSVCRHSLSVYGCWMPLHHGV